MRRAWIALAVLASVLVAAVSPLGADYGNLGCHLAAPRCDEPAWPLEALARGDVSTFVHDQPLMGPASLVLRAPFAAVANAFHADLTWHYRATLLPCLLISALLGLALVRRSRARGHFWLQTAAVGVLAFVNPLALSAIDAGHPEELVAAAGVVAAALFVLDARWALAAVALGLALATKAWAVLAVVPILLAVAPPVRRRFAGVLVVVLLVAYAPMIAGDPGRFRAVVQTAGSLGSHYGEATAPDSWFFTARPGDFTWASHVVDGQVQFSDATGYAVPTGVARLAHASLLILSVALAFVWSRWARARRPETLLLLLGAILLMRCLLDPGDHLYYHAAAATALLGYEALRRRARFPWIAGGFIAALWIITRVNDHLRTDTTFAWVYLSFAASMIALMVGRLINETRTDAGQPA
jgi:hypothetical protein